MQDSQSPFRHRLLRVLSVLAGLGALTVLFAHFGVEDIAVALAQLHPGYLSLYLVAALGVRLGFSLRWFLVARTFGPTPSFSRFVAARLAGDAVGALIPTGSVGGDPLRIGLLYGRGVGGARASAGVALDRVMELIGNTICGVTYVTVFFLTQTFESAAGNPVTLGVVVLPLLLLLAFLATPLVLLRCGIRPVSPALPRRWLRNRPRWARAIELLRRTEDDLMAFLRERPTVLHGGILGSLFIEALIIVEYHFLLTAFGMHVELPTVLMMLLTVGLVRVLPVPAGLGALEVGQVTLMAAVQGRADLGFLVGVVMRLHETSWIAVGLAALSSQGFSPARLRRAPPLAPPKGPPRGTA